MRQFGSISPERKCCCFCILGQINFCWGTVSVLSDFSVQNNSLSIKIIKILQYLLLFIKYNLVLSLRNGLSNKIAKFLTDTERFKYLSSTFPVKVVRDW